MFDISNEGIIQLNRGDSFTTPLFINKGTAIAPVRYELTDNDTLYLGVMEPNQKFENAIIRKVYTKDSETNENGDLLISFVPSDTENLLTGTYYYSFKLKTMLDGEKYAVQTIVPERKFYILN